jgi:uncharacterized protein (DUF433 family)
MEWRGTVQSLYTPTQKSWAEPRFSSGREFRSATLIHYLEHGYSVDAFLDDFPTVARDQVTAALESAHQMLIADARAAR